MKTKIKPKKSKLRTSGAFTRLFSEIPHKKLVKMMGIDKKNPRAEISIM